MIIAKSMDDFFERFDKKYNNLYSLVGPVERSFWKRVGDIVNKKNVFEQEQTPYGEILKKADDILKGDKK